MKPREAFEAAVGRAIWEQGARSGPPERVHEKLVDGSASDYLKPGRLVASLPKELREALQGLTAKDTFDRSLFVESGYVPFDLRSWTSWTSKPPR